MSGAEGADLERDSCSGSHSFHELTIFPQPPQRRLACSYISPNRHRARFSSRRIGADASQSCDAEAATAGFSWNHGYSRDAETCYRRAADLINGKQVTAPGAGLSEAGQNSIKQIRV